MSRQGSRRTTASRVALALALAAGVAGCKEDAAPPIPPRPVLVETIVPITSETFGPFASTVEARYQAQLGFQVSGRMVARDVYVGDRVGKGQRLAAIDPTIIQFNLTRAKADVADAQAQFANAQGTVGRQQALMSGGNTTQATMDNAVAARDTAKARLDQAMAALRASQDQIGYTELHASFDGVVTAWSAEVGQYVANGQAVVTVARPDIREAVVDVPDELMGRIKPGMAFLVRLQTSPSLTATAHVREIGPLADPVTRTHRVRMTLENPAQAFRIGTTLTVAVERAIAPKIVVPATAVLDDDKTHAVWLLSPDGRHVTRRAIGVAGTEDGKIVVASGLAAGDRIVTVGVHSLADGQEVGGVAGGALKAERTRL